jgi:hypothetical protein
MWGKVRRFYLIVLRKGYVRRQLSLRRGKCLQCGRCCALGYRCWSLAADQTCKAYGRWRAPNCVAFPIDERDLRDVTITGGTCGFYFPHDAKRSAEASQA